tara:strand:- start:265 stop:870 length:606 start_codon:yes stop_codon:yes gene_type:complete
MNCFSQTRIENIHPKGKIFFGGELGGAIVKLENTDISFQGGFLVEYYISNHWSISSKIKYFQTGVSFYQEGTSGLFGINERFGTFKGENIAVPLNIKWEFNILQNLSGNLKIGIAYNKELKGDYTNYSNNIDTKLFKSEYFGSVFGLGINYFLSNKSALYLDFEVLGGTKKGVKSRGLFNDEDIYNSSALVSIGYKYSFSK